MTALFGAVALTVAGFGCATKTYVAKTIDPIDARVKDVEARSTENKDQIAVLGKDISRVEERAKGADSKAEEASRQALEAGQRAEEAGTQAKQAHVLIDKSNTRIDTSIAGIQTKIENLDKYKLVATKAVVFGLNKSDLSDDAKAALNEAASGLQERTNYVIEIRGFTDASGDEIYNVGLSQRRADSVVRYLTVEHKIPLYRVHVIGVGEAEPAADNKTKAGREQNRRVELRLFSAGLNDGSELQAKQL
jgi:outer membrane protein OmpA-like peptidoglycan-associated protein